MTIQSKPLNQPQEWTFLRTKPRAAFNFPLTNCPLVIDCRTEKEFRCGAIKGAWNFDIAAVRLKSDLFIAALVLRAFVSAIVDVDPPESGTVFVVGSSDPALRPLTEALAEEIAGLGAVSSWSGPKEVRVLAGGHAAFAAEYACMVGTKMVREKVEPFESARRPPSSEEEDAADKKDDKPALPPAPTSLLRCAVSEMPFYPSQITDLLFIGSCTAATDIRSLLPIGINYVVNATKVVPNMFAGDGEGSDGREVTVLGPDGRPVSTASKELFQFGVIGMQGAGGSTSDLQKLWRELSTSKGEAETTAAIARNSGRGGAGSRGAEVVAAMTAAAQEKLPAPSSSAWRPRHLRKLQQASEGAGGAGAAPLPAPAPKPHAADAPAPSGPLQVQVPAPAAGTLRYLQCLVEDSDAQEMVPTFVVAALWIAQAVRSGRVMVHCQRGASRSVAIAAAYLLLESSRGCLDADGNLLPNNSTNRSEIWTVAKAVALIKRSRRCARPNAGFLRELERYREFLIQQQKQQQKQQEKQQEKQQ